MNNSNSFNICSRCGTANGLNAKYCYQCGSQLKVPEEPVVCPKCHTVNSSMANFCRTCGATLKVGAQTKICPKCGREVNIDENVCTCGYSFATVRIATPAEQKVANDNSAKHKRAVKEAVPLQRKGGRLVAVFALLFIALFAYVIIAPASAKLEFMRGWGMLNTSSGGVLSGYDLVLLIISRITGGIMNVSGAVFLWTAFALLSLFVLCVAIHLLICLVRLFVGKKDKKANIFYLILAILSTVAVVLLALGNTVPAFAIFASPEFSVGYTMYAITGYFWFFFIFSLFAKARKLKELKL